MTIVELVLDKYSLKIHDYALGNNLKKSTIIIIQVLENNSFNQDRCPTSPRNSSFKYPNPRLLSY